MLPSENTDEEEESRYDPGDGDHPDDAILGAPAPVFGRDLDRAEAIDGDEEDRVLGHEADRVVDREPEVAEQRAEIPVAHQHVHRVKRHRDRACKYQHTHTHTHA